MEEEQLNGNRATHVFKNAKRLRLRIKPRMSQAKLARVSDVSADTLRKVERGEAVTEPIAVAIFDALNNAIGGLKYEAEVLHKSQP